jgi:hypothetical protein
LSLDLLEELLFGLDLGEILSDGSGESWSEVLWDLVQRVAGLVLLVVLSDGLSALESGLDLISSLLVDNGKLSGNGLSNVSDFGNVGLVTLSD